MISVRSFQLVGNCCTVIGSLVYAFADSLTHASGVPVPPGQPARARPQSDKRRWSRALRHGADNSPMGASRTSCGDLAVRFTVKPPRVEFTRPCGKSTVSYAVNSPLTNSCATSGKVCRRCCTPGPRTVASRGINCARRGVATLHERVLTVTTRRIPPSPIASGRTDEVWTEPVRVCTPARHCHVMTNAAPDPRTEDSVCELI